MSPFHGFEEVFVVTLGFEEVSFVGANHRTNDGFGTSVPYSGVVDVNPALCAHEPDVVFVCALVGLVDSEGGDVKFLPFPFVVGIVSTPASSGSGFPVRCPLFRNPAGLSGRRIRVA